MVQISTESTTPDVVPHRGAGEVSNQTRGRSTTRTAGDGQEAGSVLDGAFGESDGVADEPDAPRTSSGEPSRCRTVVHSDAAASRPYHRHRRQRRNQVRNTITTQPTRSERGLQPRTEGHSGRCSGVECLESCPTIWDISGGFRGVENINGIETPNYI